MAADYDGSVEQLHRAFSDEQYWLSRLAESGADDARLDAMTIGKDGGIDVRTTQVLVAERLPGMVSQFHRGDISIEREETWSPLRDRQATATVQARIAGAPATMEATATLAPAESGNGSRLELKAVVEVRVPLVGAKLEGFIGNQLVNLIIAEQRFTTVWITKTT